MSESFDRLVCEYTDKTSVSERAKKTLSTRYKDKYEGWREITSEEFAKSRFFVECIVAHQYKQVIVGDHYEGAHCFIFHDGGGYAMVRDYWKGILRIFEFGCKHDMEYVEQLGRCFRWYRCKKCGYTQDIDSSD